MRTFGIEIEYKYSPGQNRESLIESLREKGINVYSESYNHSTRTHWKIVSDSTVGGGDELVSPPLTLEQISQVNTVCDVLTDLECKIDRSCGLHVHIGASDLSFDSIKHIMKAWVRYEFVVDSIIPDSRRRNNNQYCQSAYSKLEAICVGGFTTHRGAPSPVRVNQCFDSLKDATSRQQIENDRNHKFHSWVTDRFCKLNLVSLVRHGTLEFRHHSGTVEAEKVVNWIQFCHDFVVAFSDTSRRISKMTETLFLSSADNGSKYPSGTYALLTAIGWKAVEMKKFRDYFYRRQRHFAKTGLINFTQSTS